MTPERYKEITELTEDEQALAVVCIRAGKPIIQTRTVTFEELEELRALAPNHWISRGPFSRLAKIRKIVA